MRIYEMFTRGLLIILVAVLAVSCEDSDDAPSEHEVRSSQLLNVWHATEVRQNGSIMDGYENFTLILSGTPSDQIFQYTAQDRPFSSPWAASGTWSLNDSHTSGLFRDPGTGEQIEMEYTVTDNKLILNFSYSGENYINAKVLSTQGQWSFTFSL